MDGNAIRSATKVVAAGIITVGFANVANGQLAEASATLSARVEAYQSAWNAHDPSALAARIRSLR